MDNEIFTFGEIQMGVLLNHAVDLAQLNSCICYSIFSEATDNISQSKFIIFPNMNSYLISHLFYTGVWELTVILTRCPVAGRMLEVEGMGRRA